MTLTRPRVGAPLALALAVAILAAASGAARAQRVDAERPRTLVVGAPAGARADRGDGARAGHALPLPRGSLRVAWRTALGTFLEHAPVVDARGGSYLVTLRGDVIALGPDGGERWRVPTGATQPGAAALLADDTVVFADTAGQAIAVRDASVRWRARFARPDADPQAPIALDDGGVVVATGHEIAVLDVDGNDRARAVLPEVPAGPPLWTDGRVLVIGVDGGVWSWARGAAPPERIGAFPSPVDGGAALADARTLVGVEARDDTLVAFDLAHPPNLESGAITTRAVSSRRGWRGPPAVATGGAGDRVFVLGAGPSGAVVATAIDGSGEDAQRATLAPRTPLLPSSADAGATGLPATVAPTPPIVDASGTLAFATQDGAVGVASFSADGSTRGEGAPAPLLDRVGDACPAPLAAVPGSNGPARAVTGFAALPGEVLLVVCRSGAVLALRGRSGH
jgi:outer membrane protein assembly factor BamB